MTDATEWISTTQAAELVGVNPATVWRWASEGHIEARKIGWQWIVDKADVIRYKAYRDEQSRRKGE